MCEKTYGKIGKKSMKKRMEKLRKSIWKGVYGHE